MPPLHPHGPPAEPAGCGIEAFGLYRASFGALPALRQRSGMWPDRPGLASTIRTADEQTLLGLAAVLCALEAPPLRGRSFDDWGVIASARHVGRLGVAVTLERFRRQGPPGMSPLIIPTLSLHAVAGTLSMALGCHGPNVGVGGGTGHLGEALLAALAMIRGDDCPGLWLVLTECDPEPVPDVQGRPTASAEGHAVALALVPEAAGDAALCLRMRSRATAAMPTLASLADFLTAREAGRAAAWLCPLPGGGEVELLDRAAAAASGDDEIPPRRLLAG